MCDAAWAATLLPGKQWRITARPVRALAAMVLLLPIASACSSPTGPSVPDCEYYHTGTLALVNLSDTGNSRDVYVDGRFLTTVRFQTQITATADARVLHTVEWVSSVTGNTVDSIRVAVDECSTATVTNVY